MVSICLSIVVVLAYLARCLVVWCFCCRLEQPPLATEPLAGQSRSAVGDQPELRLRSTRLRLRTWPAGTRGRARRWRRQVATRTETTTRKQLEPADGATRAKQNQTNFVRRLWVRFYVRNLQSNWLAS